jgi:predicted DNA-binding ribbon-helix-helix protein
MKSANAKRSVVIDGHKTSVSLEEPFWSDVQAIARTRDITLSYLLKEIDGKRRNANLSSAVRVFVLQHHMARSEATRPQAPELMSPAAAESAD